MIDMKRSNFIMWICVLMIAVAALSSCSSEAVAQDLPEQHILPEGHKIESNTFTIVWESNQIGAYVEFNKHTIIDCEDVRVETETHREHRFNVSIEDFQQFDIHIRRTETVKNPELYLAIYRGDILQYEQEVTTNGFVYMGWVDELGNIGE